VKPSAILRRMVFGLLCNAASVTGRAAWAVYRRAQRAEGRMARRREAARREARP